MHYKCIIKLEEYQSFIKKNNGIDYEEEIPPYGVWEYRYGKVEEKKYKYAIGLVPVRIEMPFYIFKFYDYFAYCSLFAESPLWGFAGKNGAFFFPTEVGIKLKFHSLSSNSSLSPNSKPSPLEIRLGYMLFRSSETNETGSDGETHYYRNEKYSTFYMGVTVHLWTGERGRCL